MLNQYPLWKYIVLFVVLVFSVIYALPNVYGDDPALQISNRAAPMADKDISQIKTALKSDNINYKSIELSNKQALVRFSDTETQLHAAEKLRRTLNPNQYTVALNLAPATPQWLRDLNAAPMYLGLDLRGGVHFLMEVDMEAAIKRMDGNLVSDIRTYLREQKIRYSGVNQTKTGLVINFRDAENLNKAEEKLGSQSQFRDLTFTPDPNGLKLDAKLTELAIRNEKSAALHQNIITLRNRVNELGVAEPIIQQQGDSRIVVELPGIQDTAQAKRILGATATLEFRLTEKSRQDWYEAEKTGQPPVNALLYHERNGHPVLLSRNVIVTGDQITDAAATIDSRSGQPAVSVRLDGKGAKKMRETTLKNVGHPMAVVFIENKVVDKKVGDKIVKKHTTSQEVINIATIQEPFGAQFQITGLKQQEAHDLALLLRAGSLRAPVQIVEERTVGPSLGKDNIKQGIMSVKVGLLLVLVFMIVYYRVFGVIANIALTFNMILLVAVLSLLQATLTMPGIAGIVLTIGMAVDANVLIYERIREELRNGNTPQASIFAGYEKAFGTILDSNVTTLITGIVLFSLGTGPVKGFAVTLCIGILTSMFTAIMGTRAIVNFLYGNRNIKKISI